MSNLEQALGSVKASIKTARLVAVSKTVTAEVIQEVYDCGQRLFGENRIDVLMEKVATLPSDIEWHFIGNIQSRQIKNIVANSCFIHSVDCLDKITKIDNACKNQQKRINYLLQVNVSGEEVKSGFSIEEARAAIKLAIETKHADCVGLMTMAPFVAEESELRQVFIDLRQLRDALEEEFDFKLPELSMGMSNDYRLALEEGATLVRVGSAIFNS